MKQEKEKPTFRIAVIIIVILEAVVLSGIIVYLIHDHSSESDINGSSAILTYDYSENGKYVLYIGLNDKDTYDQIIPTKEAKDIVNEICVKYVDGYTVSEANGGWVDEKGNLTEEMTLVYSFSGAKEADIISIMDEVLAALNQNSILVEKQNMHYTYYSGK